jgi:hypothetical protein
VTRRAAATGAATAASVKPIMKLTVGPLPSAVYWRRRAVVLAALLAASFAVLYTCGGAGTSGASKISGTATPLLAPTTSPAGGTETILTPTTGSPPASEPVPSLSSAEPVPTGPCADAEMAVQPVPRATTMRQGSSLGITLKIKNISNRTCTRDVGASAQELYIQQGSTKIWSSDACDPLTGVDVRTFAPGVEIEAYVVWNAKMTSQGCDSRPWAPVGGYQVVGRLGTRFSDPVPLEITA